MDWLNNLFGSTGLSGLFNRGAVPGQVGPGLLGALNQSAGIAPGTGMGRGINTDLATGATSDVAGSNVPNPAMMQAMANRIGGNANPLSGLQAGLTSMGTPGNIPGGASQLGTPPVPANYSGTGPNLSAMQPVANMFAPGAGTYSVPQLTVAKAQVPGDAGG